ncbi:uncharacterized protein LOC120346920 [Styela clava]
MKFLLSILSVALVVVCVSADCYRQIGCEDKKRKSEYEYGQRWKPSTNPCYRCSCYEAKRYVLGCQKAVEKESSRAFSVKKSAFIARLYKLPTEQQFEDIEITREEAKTIECDPVPGPIFNIKTEKFQNRIYRNVYYYYTEKQSQCCSRTIAYRSIHPSCEAVQISECRWKVVQKDHPTEPCNGPMSFVG